MTKKKLRKKGGRRIPGQLESGKVKKSVYLELDENEALRRRSFETMVPENRIIRAALRKFLGLPAPLPEE